MSQNRNNQARGYHRPVLEQEHERAAGAWHSEWAPLNQLLLTTGYPLRGHDDGDLTAWIADLADHGVSGVAIKRARHIGLLPYIVK